MQRRLQCRGNHAQRHAKLRQARSQLGIDRDKPQVARGGDVGVQCALKQRRGDACDGDYREQRHLQARIEKAAGACGQQANRCKADGVERAAFAVKQPGQQIQRNHPKRALHRCGEPGEERVAERCKDGEERGRDAGKAQAARQPEDAPGHDGQVEA